MNHFKTFLTAGALALVAGVANAATYNTAGTCALTDVTNGGNADDCYGVVTPAPVNDSASLLNGNGFTGDGTTDGIDDGLWGGGWTYAARTGIGGTDGDLSVGSGTFNWAGAVYDEMLVVLKQANSFAVYLFDGGISGAGDWETTVAAFGQNAGGLSHMSIYVRGDMSEVPLPAAGFLLLGGLGGLALVRRRKA